MYLFRTNTPIKVGPMSPDISNSFIHCFPISCFVFLAHGLDGILFDFSTMSNFSTHSCKTMKADRSQNSLFLLLDAEIGQMNTAVVVVCLNECLMQVWKS